MTKTLHKIGAIIIEDRKVLVGKKREKYIIPGGRIEPGESHEDCLRRELQEEFQVDMVSFTFFGQFTAEAALDPGMRVVMDVYEVTINGEPRASSEITDGQFVTSSTTLPLGSIIQKEVIPKLVEEGKID